MQIVKGKASGTLKKGSYKVIVTSEPCTVKITLNTNPVITFLSTVEPVIDVETESTFTLVLSKAIAGTVDFVEVEEHD